MNGHASDCAVHNAPAYEPGECDCGKEDEMSDPSNNRFYRENPAAGKKPLRVGCVSCGADWIAAYLPMPVDKLARLAKGLCCPVCGATSADIRIRAEKELAHE